MANKAGGEDADMGAQPASAVNFKHLNELSDRVKGQWMWVHDAAQPAMNKLREIQNTDEDNWLRKRVRSTREAVQGAVLSSKGALDAGWQQAEDSFSSVFTAVDSMKIRALDLRRKTPQLLVAAVTLAAVAPVYRAGVRPVVRNLVIGGGAAAFFLYPEFIARTAPYVDKASTTVSKHAFRQAQKLGLAKGED